MWYSVETFWCDESHTRFFLVHLIFKEDMWFCLKKKSFNVSLYSHMYWLIFFKLGVMIETTKLYSLKSVWMTLTFIQGHSCIRIKNFCVHFLRNFTIWMNFSRLPQLVGLLKLMLNLLCTSSIHGRRLCWCGFIKYMFNIILSLDTCEPFFQT